MLGLSKCPTVTDPRAIIHGQNRVAPTRKILIEAIRVVVIVVVMPSEEHLSDWTTVHEDHRWRFACYSHRLEELTVDLEPIGGLEDHLLGFSQAIHGEACGQRLRRNWPGALRLG